VGIARRLDFVPYLACKPLVAKTLVAKTLVAKTKATFIKAPPSYQTHPHKPIKLML
jgi:hypothetical protein